MSDIKRTLAEWYSNQKIDRRFVIEAAANTTLAGQISQNPRTRVQFEYRTMPNAFGHVDQTGAAPVITLPSEVMDPSLIFYAMDIRSGLTLWEKIVGMVNGIITHESLHILVSYKTVRQAINQSQTLGWFKKPTDEEYFASILNCIEDVFIEEFGRQTTTAGEFLTFLDQMLFPSKLITKSIRHALATNQEQAEQGNPPDAKDFRKSADYDEAKKRYELGQDKRRISLNTELSKSIVQTLVASHKNANIRSGLRRLWIHFFPSIGEEAFDIMNAATDTMLTREDRVELAATLFDLLRSVEDTALDEKRSVVSDNKENNQFDNPLDKMAKAVLKELAEQLFNSGQVDADTVAEAEAEEADSKSGISQLMMDVDDVIAEDEATKGFEEVLKSLLTDGKAGDEPATGEGQAAPLTTQRVRPLTQLPNPSQTDSREFMKVFNEAKGWHRVSAFLRSKVMAPSSIVVGKSGSSIHPLAISRIVTDGRIFSQEEDVSERYDDDPSEVVILVDWSGSMDRIAQQVLGVAARLTTSLIEARYKVTLLAYTTDRPTDNVLVLSELYKEGDNKQILLKQCQSLITMDDQHSTPTAEAMVAAMQYFSKRKGRKTIIVMTDGSPNRVVQKDGREVVKRLAESLRNTKQIGVFSISLGDGSISIMNDKIFGVDYNINGTQKLDQQLQKFARARI